MKAFKILITVAVVLIALGYGVYYYGTKIASEKLVNEVSNQLEQSGELENIKQSVENDPELKSFVEDAKNADTSKLPFHTKEDATRVLVKKFGVSGLMDIQTKLQNGSMTREQLMQEAEGKLTEDEILALKVIAYKEIYKQ